MLHIYYGNGKGKTSAAIGLACRMIGAGKSVQFIQFLKDGDSSEIEVLKNMGVEVVFKKLPTTFVDFSNPNMVKEVSALQMEIFMTLNRQYDCIILDEVLDVMTLSLINEGTVFDCLKALVETHEIVLTGRQPSMKFRQLASYATEMKNHKHPYQQGMRARKGIEF